MVQTVDSQLHHMCQDLKEVIEQMNLAADVTQEDDSEVSEREREREGGRRARLAQTQLFGGVILCVFTHCPFP